MSTFASARLDPRDLASPRLYDGVRTRRIFAFLVDYTLVTFLWALASVLVFFVGVVTLGLGWLLYAVLFPLVAIVYVGFTMGGASQATPGMGLMGLRLERLDGLPTDPALAVLHSILFWVANVATSGFILLLGLFTPRKQLLQDLLLGTVVVRSR